MDGSADPHVAGTTVVRTLVARAAVVRTLVVGLLALVVVTAQGCASASGPATVAASQPLCDKKVPTFPVRPRRTEGPNGKQIYVQDITPIVSGTPPSGYLCRYRDSDLAMSARLTSQELLTLPGLLNKLPPGVPTACAGTESSLAVDLLGLVADDGSLRRVFVGHDSCIGVNTDGQVRSSSGELLKWLDRVLSDEGRVPLPSFT